MFLTTIVFSLTKIGQDRFIKTQHDTANDLPEDVVALFETMPACMATVFNMSLDFSRTASMHQCVIPNPIDLPGMSDLIFIFELILKQVILYNTSPYKPL